MDCEGLIHLVVQGAGSGNTNAGNDQPWTVPGDKITEPRAIHLATNGDLLITTNDKGFIRSVDRVSPAPIPVPEILVSGTEVQLSWPPIYKSGVLLESSQSPAGPWLPETPSNRAAASLLLESPSRFFRLRGTSLAGGR